jgi:amidophosphoribosyltransferase
MADELHEECGVFGIYHDAEAVTETYWGIFSLQHRGQESAGIAVVAEDGTIAVRKGMGLVTEVLNPVLAELPKGLSAIGHVRYSTSGESEAYNAQPLLMRTRFGPIALAHNGNVVNAETLRTTLEAEGAVFQGTSDSEILAHLIAKSSQAQLMDALTEAISALRGGYAFLILHAEGIYAVRDPHGIRPMVLGRSRSEEGYVVASETCALDIVNARYLHDVKPGELIHIGPEGLSRRLVGAPAEVRDCAFESVYFARADSRIRGESAQMARRRLGRVLAREAPVEADVVVGVPDSSLPHAMGYAEALGIPFDFGLVKNRYIGRTFIMPRQADRTRSVQLKLSAVAEVVRGKRVVLVDDSLVRGTNSRYLIQLLRRSGATEVHMRIASPPYTDPCYYGIDTSRATELAARTNSVEEIRQMVGADSLAYLSLEGLRAGLKNDGWCLACFGGGYPVVPDGIKEETHG